MGKSCCDSSQLWLKMTDPSLFFYSSMLCSSILFSAISEISQLNFLYLPLINTKTQQFGCTLYLWYLCFFPQPHKLNLDNAENHGRVTRVTDQGDQNQLSWHVGPEDSEDSNSCCKNDVRKVGYFVNLNKTSSINKTII